GGPYAAGGAEVVAILQAHGDGRVVGHGRQVVGHVGLIGQQRQHLRAIGQVGQRVGIGGVGDGAQPRGRVGLTHREVAAGHILHAGLVKHRVADQVEVEAIVQVVARVGQDVREGGDVVPRADGVGTDVERVVRLPVPPGGE